MVSIPVWLVGKHVTAVTLTPQSVASDGTITDTTPVATMVGHVDEVTISMRSENEEISPMNTTRLNHVQLKVGTTITIHEILKSNGTNYLATAATGATAVFKVLVTRGGQGFTFYGLLESYEEGLRRGKSTGSMTLAMLDISAANPAYA